MKHVISAIFLTGIASASTPSTSSDLTEAFQRGTPAIRSMSVLVAGPEGILFVGDSHAGAVFALDLDDKQKTENDKALKVRDVETKVAGLLGARAEDVLIHDMAVNPLSQNVYLSVSRGRGRWTDRWQLPNDLDNPRVLLRVNLQGEIEEVPLSDVRFAQASLPNPIETGKKHPWKKEIDLRVDTITDMAYADGQLFVAGLSNEEFSSTMWRIPFPFGEGTQSSTLEIYHGAHGEYETHAPIRTFLPFSFEDKPHLLASYLCTPLVTFPVSDLRDKQHVKGRTIAEFGFGNYPLDMVVYQKSGKDYILIANNNLPFIIVEPAAVEAFSGKIDKPVKSYTAGVAHTQRSGSGIQQLDNLNAKFVLVLERLASGRLDLSSYPISFL